MKKISGIMQDYEENYAFFPSSEGPKISGSM